MNKLHRLNQRNMSIKEYRQKMELYMMGLGIRKYETVTVARFMSDLSLEIRDKVELLPYRNFHDLVQICIKIEQQILKKGLRKSSYLSSYPKKDPKREEKFVKEKLKGNPFKPIAQESFKKKDEPIALNRTSDIKFFKYLGWGYVKSQCPSMRTILMKAQDEYSNEEDINEESTSDESDYESRKDVYAHDGGLLMIRKTLNNQPSLQTESQRENIFHTCCKISENTCSLIIDSGSCCI